MLSITLKPIFGRSLCFEMLTTPTLFIDQYLQKYLKSADWLECIVSSKDAKELLSKLVSGQDFVGAWRQ